MELFEYIGQTEIINKIKSHITSGRVSHAYIFCGSPGMGKRTLAHLFAGALLCESTGKGMYTGGAEEGATYAGGTMGAVGAVEGATYAGGAVNAVSAVERATYAGCAACGKCVPCRLFESGSNPDIRVISSAQKSISVDEIRGAVDWLYIRPSYSEWKVYIIEEADKMTVQAQNAILKTLEEPPPYAIAILTLANPQSLLDTVRSRCVMYNFSRYSEWEVDQILRRQMKKNAIDDSNVPLSGLYSRIADGVPGRGIELMKSEGFLELREHAIGLLQRHIEGDPVAFVRMVDFLGKSKDAFDKISKILIYWLRDMWLYEMHGSDCVLINIDKKSIIKSLRGKCRIHDMLDCIMEIENTGMAIAANANYSLAINVMLLKISSLRRQG